MNNKFVVTLFLLASLGFLFVFAACATDEGTKSSASANYWDNKKGNCESVLSSAHAYPVSQIAQCTKLWEMYRYVDNIPLKERSMYAVAFSKVSHLSADPYDRGVADAALSRICIPRHPLGSNGEVVEQIPDKLDCDLQLSDLSVGGQKVASGNPYERIKGTIEVREPSAADAKKARDSYKKASAERKKNSLGKAIKLYNEALSYDPFYVAAKYDLACALSVSSDESGALRALEELYTWNDSEAEQRIVKARSDEDFDYIRDNPNFKLMTGYVRIALINGAFKLGEPTVASMKKKLEQRNFPVAEVGKSRRVELQPQIWYREGFDDYANQIKNILGIKKITVKQLQKKEQAATENDILVVWGQPDANTPGGGQGAPVVQGERAKGSDNKLKDVTDTVNDTKSSVDGARQAGESLTNWK